ncbi:MAG: hypothetical protein JSS00_11545 [Proteobacteria bacterium]|nr:hypothetical protein [Pseudomonadota bacterium]
MVDIRIVCARDAVRTADTLRRLLEAEQHRVSVSIGRHSLDQFAHALESGEIALLIWSANAPGAHYMLEWAERFDRRRIIEIADATGCPDFKRTAPVIDFVGWNGTRGSRAWVALSERLRPFSRVREIKAPPPRQAMMALGFAAAAAMVGAVVVRVHAGPANLPTPEPEADALHVTAGDGVGGPLERLPTDAVEPPSIEDVVLVVPPRIAPLPQLHVAPEGPLVDLSEAPHVEIRQPTLLERLAELNPLQQLAEQLSGGYRAAPAANATAPSNAPHGEASSAPPSAPTK